MKYIKPPPPSEHLMIHVYIHRTAEILIYHMHTATELAALVAAFQCMDGWDRIEADIPGEPLRMWTPRPR